MKQTDRESLPYVLLWAFIFVVVLFAAAQPVSIQTQFFISGTLLFAMALIKISKPDKTWRTIFIFLAGFIVLRYALWRITNTLPEVSDFLSFVPGILIFIAELYAIFMFFLSTFVVIDPIDRDEAPLPPEADKLPSVDVFVPTYNEEEDLLEVTLLAAREMVYAGKLTVYLLDDGGTEQKRNDPDPDKARKALERHESLKVLCNRLSSHKVPIKYLTRKKNEHAKAGNMNAALDHTDGDLILILDADHVPTANFLDRTVGYFLRDPKLFLVQTPHFFITPDPLEKNLETFTKMPSENEMFYSVIQKGLDKWNAAFFCGSAAVIRRRVLGEVDGFSGESITEDAETALELHARGYNSLYVAEPLVAGLHPETFSAFIGQRSRWSQGMMQIFLLKNPLFKKGLKLQQRLSYTSSSMFWLFPFARLAFLLAPLFYLFFGLEIYNASAAEFIGYTMTYMIATLMVQNFLYGSVRWPLISELYEYVQSLFTARAILKVFMNPRAPTFNVTAKGETLSRDYVSPLFKPFLIVFLLLFAGLLAAIWRYNAFPDTQDIVLVVATWNVFNLLLAMSALGVVCELRQVRAAPRMRIKRQAEVWVGNQSVRASVEDISATGAQILVPYEQGNALFRAPRKRTDDNGETTTEQGTVSVLRVLPGEYTQAADPDRAPDDVTFEVRNIRPTEGNLSLGVRFMPQSVDEATAAVRMMFAESRHWQEFQAERTRAPGAFDGTIGFFINSFRYGWTAAKFFWNHLQQSREAPPPVQDAHAGPPLPPRPVPQPANESEPGPMVAEVDASGRRRYAPPASAVAMAGVVTAATGATGTALAMDDLPAPAARGDDGGGRVDGTVGDDTIPPAAIGTGRTGWRLRRRSRPGEAPAGFNPDDLTARGDRVLSETWDDDSDTVSPKPDGSPSSEQQSLLASEGAPIVDHDPGASVTESTDTALPAGTRTTGSTRRRRQADAEQPPDLNPTDTRDETPADQAKIHVKPTVAAQLRTTPHPQAPARPGPQPGAVAIRPVAGQPSAPAKRPAPSASGRDNSAGQTGNRSPATIVPMRAQRAKDPASQPRLRGGGQAPAAPTSPGGAASIVVGRPKPVGPADRPSSIAAIASLPSRDANKSVAEGQQATTGRTAAAGVTPPSPQESRSAVRAQSTRQAPATGSQPQPLTRPPDAGFNFFSEDEPTLSFDAKPSTPPQRVAAPQAQPPTPPSPAARPQTGAVPPNVRPPANPTRAQQPGSRDRPVANRAPGAPMRPARVTLRPATSAGGTPTAAPPASPKAPSTRVQPKASPTTTRPPSTGSVSVRPVAGGASILGSDGDKGGTPVQAHPTRHPPTRPDVAPTQAAKAARPGEVGVRPASPQPTIRPTASTQVAQPRTPRADPQTARATTSPPQSAVRSLHETPSAEGSVRTPKLSISPIGVQSRGTGRRLTRAPIRQDED